MNSVARALIVAVVCAVSGPAFARNDGLAILGLEEQPQAPPSAPMEPIAPAQPGRGRFGGGLIELLLTGGRAPAPQPPATDPSPQAALARDRAGDCDGGPAGGAIPAPGG